MKNNCNPFIEDIKLQNALSELRIYCKCGHSMILPIYEEKVICRWCGNYIFRAKKDEFKYRLKEKINKEKRIK